MEEKKSKGDQKFFCDPIVSELLGRLNSFHLDQNITLEKLKNLYSNISKLETATNESSLSLQEKQSDIISNDRTVSFSEGSFPRQKWQ